MFHNFFNNEGALVNVASCRQWAVKIHSLRDFTTVRIGGTVKMQMLRYLKSPKEHFRL